MSASIPMRELVERLCRDRGLSIEEARNKALPPRINMVQLDNLRIIRDLGAANLEVWESEASAVPFDAECSAERRAAEAREFLCNEFTKVTGAAFDEAESLERRGKNAVRCLREWRAAE